MNNGKSNVMGRRHALVVLGAGLGTAGGLATLAGCNKGGGSSSGGQGAQGPAPAPVAQGPSCPDQGDIDESAANIRKMLKYKDKYDTPEKKCSLCAQYIPGKYGSCGGCKMFAGGVQPDGVCLSFAPLQAAPAPGGAAPAPGAAPAAAPAGKTG
jgi:hypothetical protein